MADESPWDWAQRVFVGQKGAPESPNARRARLAPGPLSAAGALSDLITAGFRGAAKTSLGWPGDIERLVGDTLPEIAGSYRSGAPLEWNLQNALSALDRTKNNHTILPSSEDLDRWLPPATTFSVPQKQNPMGSIAEWAALTPGQVGKVASGTAGMVRGGLDALAQAHAVGSAGRGLGGFGQRGAVRPRGGNFDSVSLESQLDDLRQFVPEDVPAGQTSRQEHINTWVDKQLGNYVRKDLGSPADPLLQVEKELPNLHLPEGWQLDERVMRNVNQYWSNIDNYVNNHLKLSGGAPVTPWGWHSDGTLSSNSPEDYARFLIQRKYRGKERMADELYLSAAAKGLVPGADPVYFASPVKVYGYDKESLPARVAQEFTKGDPLGVVAAVGKTNPELLPLIEHFKAERAKVVPPWVDAASPDTKIWNLDRQVNDDLGLRHIVDYLSAATEGHEIMALMTPEARQLHARNPQAFGGHINNLLALHNAGLTLDPRSLGRLSVADAVRKTAAWNEHLANQVESSPDLARGIVRTHKEYPDGHKWVELGEGETPKELPPGLRLQSTSGYADDSVPGRSYGYQDLDDPTKARIWRVVNEAGDDVGNGWGGHDGRGQEAVIAQFHKQKIRDDLSAGLNAEGKAMGHCVGRYCDEVTERGTKIYSLRDKAGNPHVTIEVNPSPLEPKQKLRMTLPQEEQYELERLAGLSDPQGNGKPWPPSWPTRVSNAEMTRRGRLMDELAAQRYPDRVQQPTEDIIQIKGKRNAAPVEKYLPAVQDFVKSGNWGQVGEIRNSGLRESKDVFNETELRKLKAQGREVPRHLTQGEIDDLQGGFAADQAYATGGSVATPVVRSRFETALLAAKR